ncbi:MAG: DUF4097 family beta strand repeat-containing protein [Blautia sp.]
MKKFTKICLIIAAVMGITGGVLFAVGMAMGADWKSVQYAVDFDIPWVHYDNGRISSGDLNDIRKELDTNAVEEREYSPEEVRALDIDVKKAYVSIVNTKENKIRVKLYSKEDVLEYDRADRALSIERETDHAQKHPIRIEIPEGMTLEEVDISVGGGILELESLEARELDISVGAGTVTVTEGLKASECSIETGAGTMEIGYLDAVRTQMECGMGTIDIILAEDVNAYFVQAECGIGTVTVGAESHSGIASFTRGDRNASRNMDVECGMGTVKVLFKESGSEL